MSSDSEYEETTGEGTTNLNLTPITLESKCYSCNKTLSDGAQTNDCLACHAPYHPRCFKKLKTESSGCLSMCCERPVTKVDLNNSLEKFLAKLQNVLRSMIAKPLEDINHRVDTVETALFNVDSRVTVLEDNLARMSCANAPSPSTITNSMLREICDRNMRANNIIVFNLPETDNAEADRKKLNELIRKVPQLPECRSVLRLGQRKDTVPRPLRATFNSPNDALKETVTI